MNKKEIGLGKRPWITKGILKSMRKRDQLYKDFTLSKDNEIFIKYKEYRNMILTLTRRSKKNHFLSYFTEHQSNVKKTWEGIKSIINISKKKNTQFNKLISNDQAISGNKEMANGMNKFFVNIGSMVEAKIPSSKNGFKSYLKNRNSDSMFLRGCDNVEIESIIKEMNTSKCIGPYSIPTSILKTFSSILCEPLTTIINTSLEEGIFPDLLKIANVCPIFKKKDRTKCENYRPISLLSNLSKIFERVMHNRTADFLEKHDAIYKLQFGFRKQYSTNHDLLSIEESIRKSMDSKGYTCGVFVNLEKAFDTVNHKILLSKLEHYGIRGLAYK